MACFLAISVSLYLTRQLSLLRCLLLPFLLLLISVIWAPATQRAIYRVKVADEGPSSPFASSSASSSSSSSSSTCSSSVSGSSRNDSSSYWRATCLYSIVRLIAIPLTVLVVQVCLVKVDEASIRFVEDLFFLPVAVPLFVIASSYYRETTSRLHWHIPSKSGMSFE